MTYTRRFTESHNVQPILHPVTMMTGPHTSAYYSMRDYHRGLVKVKTGTIPAGATLDVELRQATDVNGTNAKAVSGKAITQLTDADDDAMVAIEFVTADLDVDNAFDCVAVKFTPAVDTIPMDIELIRYEPRFEPVGTENYDEVVD